MKKQSTDMWQLIATVAGVVVGIVGLIQPNWAAIPTTWLPGARIFFTVVLVAAGSIVAWQLTKLLICIVKRRIILVKMKNLVAQLSELLSADITFSIRRLAFDLCNQFSGDPKIAPTVRCMHSRLNLLANWRYTLQTFAIRPTGSKYLYIQQVLGVVTFHRELADVVREFDLLKIHHVESYVVPEDYVKIAKEKYNKHIDRLEQVLIDVAKLNPELKFTGFYRF